MAIDPIYIRVDRRPRVRGARRRASLDRDERRDARDLTCRRAHVEYARGARAEEPRAPRAFEHFLDVEWARQSSRARGLRAFAAAEAWWLDDYALFRAIHEREAHRPWTDWPAPLRDESRRRSATARRTLRREMLFHSTCSGWRRTSGGRARAPRTRTAWRSSAICRSWSIGDSADVWARQRDFHLDSLGRRAARRVQRDRAGLGHAGLPLGRRSPPAASAGCTTARGAAPRCTTATASTTSSASIAPTPGRAAVTAEPRFEPATKPRSWSSASGCWRSFARPAPKSSPKISASCRTSSGRRWRASACPASACFAGSGSGIWSRTAVSRSGGLSGDLGGHLRHARHRTDARLVGQRGRRRTADGRRRFRPCSASRPIATCSTAPYRAGSCATRCSKRCSPSGSALLLLPVQDVFGWSDRINEPATVEPDNWTFRLPWPCDRLDDEAERAGAPRRAAGVGAEHGRL